MLAQPTQQKLRVYRVYRYVKSVKQFVGNVQAENHVLADKKALNLFGSGCWTEIRED